MCASLTRLFDGRAMGRALAVSLPLFVLYSASGDANWLLANIATISVAVVVERVGGAPLAALGQGWRSSSAFSACRSRSPGERRLPSLAQRSPLLLSRYPAWIRACARLGNFVSYSCALSGLRGLPRRTALRCPWCRISSSRRYHRWRSPVSIPCATQRSHAVTVPCCAGGAHLTGHAAAHDELLQAVLAVTLAVACSATWWRGGTSNTASGRSGRPPAWLPAMPPART